ncbi:MAG: AAA family ATPase [Ruminococcus sp.]|nr:AAA family ATPase [Ruminococcus sp.]
MIDFLENNETINTALDLVKKSNIDELEEEYSDIKSVKHDNLPMALGKIFFATKVLFVFIIDECDCIFRTSKSNKEAQKVYLDFFRKLLKDKSYVVLAYITGILPVKQYDEHSALNMFTEVSMTDPREYAEFTGFTEFKHYIYKFISQTIMIFSPRNQRTNQSDCIIFFMVTEYKFTDFFCFSFVVGYPEVFYSVVEFFIHYASSDFMEYRICNFRIFRKFKINYKFFQYVLRQFLIITDCIIKEINECLKRIT